MSKTCFVVQGYGRKTDFESGRTLDLDASYDVIKEAVEKAGLLCIRGDEIPQTGHIEREMYEQLLLADLVIADLSTSNVNAFYELGVRFALRPYATIVVAESKINFPFDINHIPIRTYEHLGSDVGRKEAKRFIADLVKLIDAIMAKVNTDSPVFTFLPHLAKQKADTGRKEDLSTRSIGPSPSALKRAAREAMDGEDFIRAARKWEEAREVGPKDDHVVQQLALATYKSKEPSEVEAFRKARGILERLWPRDSLDPETLGLWAAVHKNLFELEGDRADLEEAIEAAERGFVLRRDYYTGINLAFLLDTRGAEDDAGQARAIRRRVEEICNKALEAGDDLGPGERYWVLATLRECAVGLGDEAQAAKWGEEAKKTGPKGWMLSTTEKQLGKLRELLG